MSSLRVLMVHNEYRSGQPSGENRSVEEQVGGLRDAGVEVLRFRRSSDVLAALGPFRRSLHVVDPLGVPSLRRDFVAAIERFSPDVVHLENLWPMISPAVVRISRERCIPVVAGVRNFRLSCVAGTHFRSGSKCDECLASRLAAVRHGCYQDSRLATVPVALSSWKYAEDLRSLDHFLPNSRFMGEYLRSLGIDEGRITVRPNAVPDPGAPAPLPGVRTVLYLGRLSEEKGVGMLLEAWAGASKGGCQLVLVGDGPLRERAMAIAASDSSLKVLGLVPGAEVSRLIAASSFVVAPSNWPEPFGRVAIEAFASGRPALVTAVGGLQEVVTAETGWVVEPSLDELRHGLEQALGCSDSELQAMSRKARARYEELYSPSTNIEVLLGAYSQVITARRAG